MTIENISKSYSVETLLKDISFGISEGEKIGIIGVNGTGKSTLLKIIAGVETPETGKITKGNRVRIEYLSQNPHFDEEATVLEQVFKGNSPEMKLLRDYQEILDVLQNEYNDEINERLLKLQDQIDRLNLWDLESEAKSVLTKLGITNFSQKVKELSGGQRKRVALASALITPCELLILDEPTSSLDPVKRSEVLEKFQEFIENGDRSIVFSSHITTDIEHICDYVVFINKGNLIFASPTIDLLYKNCIARCTSESFNKLDKSYMIAYSQKNNQVVVLLKSRDDLDKSIDNIIIENPTLEEIMNIYSKGTIL